jgi:hypothetical protein
MASDSKPIEDVAPPRHRATVEWRPVELERLCVTRIVGRSYAAVEERLRVRPEQVLRAAYGEEFTPGDAVISIAPHPRLSWLRMRVRVESFTRVGEHHGVISIRWTPTRMVHLLPTMEADLSIHAGANEETELVLDGKYRPPLGLLGLVIDRVIGRWVASFTAATFVDRLADSIEHTAQ